MKTIINCLIILLLLSSKSVNSQANNVSAVKVLEGIEKLQLAYFKMHYKAEMLFKEAGSDTFLVRSFFINYEQNPGNPLYGYDCEVGELFKDSSYFTIMALNNSMYGIYTGTKIISERTLP